MNQIDIRQITSLGERPLCCGCPLDGMAGCSFKDYRKKGANGKVIHPGPDCPGAGPKFLVDPSEFKILRFGDHEIRYIESSAVPDGTLFLATEKQIVAAITNIGLGAK